MGSQLRKEVLANLPPGLTSRERRLIGEIAKRAKHNNRTAKLTPETVLKLTELTPAQLTHAVQNLQARGYPIRHGLTVWRVPEFPPKREDHDGDRS